MPPNPASPGVSVMTWNVENLFRPGGRFGPHSRADYEGKLDALAATITRVAPDVLGLQEVGQPGALADLVDRLDGEWHHATSKHFDPHHPIRVAVLARERIEVLADVADFPEPLAAVQVDDAGATVGHMGRGALAVHVTPAPGLDLVVAVCHLKSKLLSYPGNRFGPRDEGERARYGAYALDRRAAEAVTVRVLADGLLDGAGTTRNVIVMGDLNDEPQAATTQILNGPPGSEVGTRGALLTDRGDADRLFNLAPLIPAESRYSRVYRGRRELIDHIFASRALLGRIASVATITQRPLPSVTDDPGERREARDSDHAPIVARLTL
jgi:endonuclease/exonuclease/phosphatase family metal-dependent hydrolase